MEWILDICMWSLMLICLRFQWRYLVSTMVIAPQIKKLEAQEGYQEWGIDTPPTRLDMTIRNRR